MIFGKRFRDLSNKAFTPQQENTSGSVLLNEAQNGLEHHRLKLNLVLKDDA